MRRLLADPSATTAFGREVALFVRPGDVLLLSGDLGAGKSTFARGLIRGLAQDAALDVPSPTFSLLQLYETAGGLVQHADLYRLDEGSDVHELGLDEAAPGAVTLVEWPERAALDILSPDRLHIEFETGIAGHQVTCRGFGRWAALLLRMDGVARFISDSGYDDWTRAKLAGDASARRYELLIAPDRERLSVGDEATVDQLVLMDSPEMPDPGTGAVPYSRVVHLAEDIRPFLAIAGTLASSGFSAPSIHAADPDQGLAVIEHLGGETILVDGKPVTERYETSIDCLVALQAGNLGSRAVFGEISHDLPSFDLAVFEVEARLVADWYIPYKTGKPAGDAVTQGLSQALQTLVRDTGLFDPPYSWVLRDYHSPNIIWRPDAEGYQKIGLIDFQDALLGPAAYDVASLAYDARVDVPPHLSENLIARFLARGSQVLADFDPTFERARVNAFAIQRNLKILGIFARLAKRDNKPAYLRHLPRIERYLSEALSSTRSDAISEWAAIHLNLSPNQ